MIVLVPIQRNPREENRRIKNGEVLEAWGETKRAQKDVDGRESIANTTLATRITADQRQRGYAAVV